MLAPIHPPRPSLAGKHVGSFAYYTIRDRIPVILTKAIDDICQTISRTPELTENKEFLREGKKVIEALASLQYDMQRDRPIRPLIDSLPDVQLWNEHLNQHWKDAGYFQAAWLFEECYIYRRINEALALTTHWRDYDPFRRDKESVFRKSNDAILSLASRLTEIYEEEILLTKKLNDSNDMTPLDAFRQASFEELIQYALWGNSIDLSLLAAAHHTDFTHLQNTNMQHLAANKKNIIIDDTLIAWSVIHNLKSARIDIVLDNAGFELLSDLFFADWLLQKNYASVIVFHIKSYPWFVSDTTYYDFTTTINNCIELADSQLNTSGSNENDKENRTKSQIALGTIARRWQVYLNSGQFRIHEDLFWTLPHSFYHLPRFPKIYHEQLLKSDFVVFKGDLNYRKLVFDCSWEPTATFAQAIGPLSKSQLQSNGNGHEINWIDSPCMKPFVTLRTCKSDVCVGLQPGQAEILTATDPQWMGNGKYAVISAYIP